MTDAKTTFIAEVESAFLQRWSAISGMRSYHSPEQNLAVISQPQCRGWVGFLADKNNWDLIRACNCPTINFSNRHGSISWAVNVFSDDDEIGRLAVSAFVARGFINFAFVGLEGHGYSRDRCDGFLKALKLKGYSAQVFNFDDKYCENPIRFASYRRDMVRQWLARMPGPTAVLAANDFAAHSFIDLISDLEPERLDSLAVIGVDNTPLSEQHDISSIAPNFAGMGRVIADELLRFTAGKPDKVGRVCRVDGAVFHERATTANVSTGDRIVVATLKLIAEQIRLGEAPRIEVLSERVGLSRRTLLNRFRSATGYSLRDYCLTERLRRAESLLRGTQHNIAEIAQACGYAKQGELTVHFRKSYGMTPKAYRQSFGKKS